MQKPPNTSPFAPSPVLGGHQDDKHHGIVMKAHDKLLDVMDWSTDVFMVTPSMHRLKSAAGLTLGLFIGVQLMNTLTGVQLYKGKNFPKSSSLIPGLERFHGKLHYNPHSDKEADIFMRVLHACVPFVLGVAGTILGSKNFFAPEYKKAKHPETLEDFENKASLIEGDAYKWIMGIGSEFSSVSGLPYLPGPLNYGSTLATRYLLSSGRKVAMPVLGKYWSNNPTNYAFAPPKMLDLMIKYAVHNKDPHPQQLERMALGVLKPWFEGVTDEQIKLFVKEVEDVRDQFYQLGGVPEELKKDMEKMLKAHIKGLGLEETLEKIGLDPVKAHIGANGLSEVCAGIVSLGASARKVETTKKEFVAKMKEHKAERAKHRAEHKEMPENMVSFADRVEAKREKEEAQKSLPNAI